MPPVIAAVPSLPGERPQPAVPPRQDAATMTMDNPAKLA